MIQIFRGIFFWLVMKPPSVIFHNFSTVWDTVNMLELCCPPVIDSYHYHIWNLLLDTWIWDIFLPGKIVSDYWPMVRNKSWKTFLFCTSLPREICATQTVISDIQIFCFNPDFTTSTTIWWGISPLIMVPLSQQVIYLPLITKLLLPIILIGPLEIWLIYVLDIQPVHWKQFRNIPVWESNPE